MQFTDENIKAVLIKYKITRSHEHFITIRTMLSAYMYHFPRKVMRCNHDDAVSFYMHVLEHLDALVLRFEERGYKFITWFTVVLRNMYLNYMRSRRRFAKKQIAELSYHAGAIPFEKILSSPKPDAVMEQAKNAADVLTRICEQRDGLVFQTHHIELFRDVIILPLADYFKVSFEEAFLIVVQARKTYWKKITSMMKLQDSMCGEQYEMKKAKEKRDAAAFAWRKARCANIRKQLQSIRCVVPHHYCASLFDMSVNAVTKVIIKIKKSLKRHMHEFSFEL